MSVAPLTDRITGRQRSAPGDGGTGQRRRRRWIALAVTTAVLAATGAGIGVYLGTRRSLTTAQLMSLSPVPNRAAPGFTLTDQRGKPLSLASLRGKAVALYFMDPRCTDVCPLVAQEFVDADRRLGPQAHQVALVGVDVNPKATARHWLTAFDTAHGLDKLPNWHFLTGPVSSLRKVWEAYNIFVTLTSSGDVQHTTVIDFIAPDGHERALAVPFAYVHHNGTGWLPHGDVSRFGQGIARELRQLI